MCSYLCSVILRGIAAFAWLGLSENGKKGGTAKRRFFLGELVKDWIEFVTDLIKMFGILHNC